MMPPLTTPAAWLANQVTGVGRIYWRYGISRKEDPRQQARTGRQWNVRVITDSKPSGAARYHCRMRTNDYASNWMKRDVTMRRRHFLQWALGAGATLLVAPVLAARAGGGKRFHEVDAVAGDFRPIDREPEYWHRHVDDDAWRILFRDGTERPYSSPLDDFYEEGTYVCAACHLPLFSSATKYDSRTGWPSFYQPFAGHIGTRPDHSWFGERTEYHCARCGGHQGHVFDDGPEPTGERWCNNGLALRFVPAADPLPPLRG